MKYYLEVCGEGERLAAGPFSELSDAKEEALKLYEEYKRGILILQRIGEVSLTGELKIVGKYQ